MKSINYEVVFEKFTERHFIKTFEKKHKGAWDITKRIITEEFRQIDYLFLKKVAEVIIDFDDIKICKTEFKIAGTEVSRHGSGNRCIVALCKSKKSVSVLLIYGKTDISSKNETVEWKSIIKKNYTEYRRYL